MFSCSETDLVTIYSVCAPRVAGVRSRLLTVDEITFLEASTSFRDLLRRLQSTRYGEYIRREEPSNCSELAFALRTPLVMAYKSFRRIVPGYALPVLDGYMESHIARNVRLYFKYTYTSDESALRHIDARIEAIQGYTELLGVYLSRGSRRDLVEALHRAGLSDYSVRIRTLEPLLEKRRGPLALVDIVVEALSLSRLLYRAGGLPVDERTRLESLLGIEAIKFVSLTMARATRLGLDMGYVSTLIPEPIGTMLLLYSEKPLALCRKLQVPSTLCKPESPGELASRLYSYTWRIAWRTSLWNQFSLAGILAALKLLELEVQKLYSICMKTVAREYGYNLLAR
ncbi:hypothetical protein Pyrde_1327 [Pyrodictium delaneyi]|uniref:V-type ATP synthase subunit C n=1 Tax=Pyrodictium delaneyi TaxID=1273541 RepID=A0A0P0N4K6_9CREN|nr:V-type ATPase subunit [Pyrodictium delaneyi]ALL01373.1 hypothetical protein Pyrde_1327 [Pyrodictium delaneyi]OWJ53798.1 hypothetical protein Pdsh_10185 [Pyrodictium delaneyi]